MAERTILRTGGLSRRKPTAFALAPDAGARTALAAELGLVALPAFAFTGEVRPVGREDLVLEGRISARAVQACVVTTDPVETAVEETLTLRYVADLPDPGAGESEMPEDTDTEPLPDQIDLMAVATEALMLSLPLYPRAPGAELGEIAAHPPGAAEEEAEPHPFAGLAGLSRGPDDKG